MSQDWQIEMPDPEAFEIVVNHLLDKFISPDDYYDGDRAIAKLHRELEGQSPMAVELGIHNCGYAIPESPVALALAEYYSAYLVTMFLCNAYSLFLITRVRLLVRFGSDAESDAPLSDGDGVPYYCKLTFAVCDGKVCIAERAGRVGD